MWEVLVRRRVLHALGWWLARQFWALDGHWPRPSNWANGVVSWMEQRGICCERHAISGEYVTETRKD